MQDMRRPATIICGCGSVVEVKRQGRIPWRCASCARNHRLARQRGETTPRRPRHLTVDACDERELGPERPLYGMTPEEYARWKAARAVRLYQGEPELSVHVIAERLDLTVEHVTSLLRGVGLRCKGDGRANLASGPPAQ
ncbi:hypothetical protein [Archangium lansingense]|uniref:Uncharacterized protein n=1 Tax=Archangium lansingense TaxID=2995310 RepID=A0ABT4AF40_9BACT|nr:hypothetical protein [Archangium lansinium]MCY1080310.1 hypothetical protein [Archangium lansinium]